MSSKWMGNPSLRHQYTTIAELALIAIWAIIVSRGYLNLDAKLWPAGNEFGSAIQSDYFWVYVQKCGWCAIWNGFEQGGYPALADIYGSTLHPIVMLTTLIWGVINGAKITFLIALWLAGVAQWWIARLLKLGLIPRLWSASIAVAGGYLSGRMDIGVLSVVLSTAMSCLLLAGIINLNVRPGRRAAVLLGILIASAILAGQGYLQIGLIGISPAVLFLLFDDKNGFISTLKQLLLAVVLGFLLASPLLVPFLHFSPNFIKPMDSQFGSAQSMAYLPLNLLIDDIKYYNSDILGKLPYPYLYTLYIGWIPVALFAFGISRADPQNRKIFWFMGSSIVLAFLMGSAEVWKWLTPVWPIMANVRNPPLIVGLAIPLILGFSAYGLEQLFKLSSQWPKLSLGFSDSNTSLKWQIPLQWMIYIPLVFSMASVYNFSKIWIWLTPMGDDVIVTLSAMKTDNLEWVEPPFGEHMWIEPAIELGLKLSPGIMTWGWQGHDLPSPSLYATRQDMPPGTVKAMGTINGITLYTSTEQYAAVVHEQTQEPCQAFGSGGQITVQCNVTQAGQLVVKENMWSGWHAWMDGRPVSLYQNQWLEVDAPAGSHTFTFRYLPWDVPLGLALSAFGVGVCIWLWFKSPQQQTA